MQHMPKRLPDRSFCRLVQEIVLMYRSELLLRVARYYLNFATDTLKIHMFADILFGISIRTYQRQKGEEMGGHGSIRSI